MNTITASELTEHLAMEKMQRHARRLVADQCEEGTTGLDTQHSVSSVSDATQKLAAMPSLLRVLRVLSTPHPEIASLILGNGSQTVSIEVPRTYLQVLQTHDLAPRVDDHPTEAEQSHPDIQAGITNSSKVNDSARDFVEENLAAPIASSTSFFGNVRDTLSDYTPSWATSPRTLATLAVVGLTGAVAAKMALDHHPGDQTADAVAEIQSVAGHTADQAKEALSTGWSFAAGDAVSRAKGAMSSVWARARV